MTSRIQNTIALFMPSLRGGGAERVMLTLACQFVAKGYSVDLVLAKAEGPYLSEVPDDVRLVNLNVSRIAFSLIGLVRYLRKERPVALLSTLNHANVIAVIAKIVSRVSTRVVLREANTLSLNVGKDKSLSGKIMPALMRLFYPLSNQVIAVSKGVASDLIREIGLPEDKLTIVYSPVVTSYMFQKADEEFDHPWFKKGQPPVILGVGRLTQQKGFDILIKAVFNVRKKIPVRLIILGEGSDRNKLEAIIKDTNLDNEISLPGFVQNPFPYMKHAELFVLSSRWEGLPNTLIQAMALGTSVVSTDCPSGPDEILESGKWGNIVNVDDANELAKSIREAIENAQSSSTCESIKAFTKQHFGVKNTSNKYLSILLDIEVV